MSEPTEAMMAMARRIAAFALCGPEKWKPGVKAGMFEAIIRGEADDEALVQGPLQAIIEATEKCAELADGWNPGRKDRVTETSIAAAIRSGNQYGKAEG